MGIYGCRRVTRNVKCRIFFLNVVCGCVKYLALLFNLISDSIHQSRQLLFIIHEQVLTQKKADYNNKKGCGKKPSTGKFAGFVIKMCVCVKKFAKY